MTQQYKDNIRYDMSADEPELTIDAMLEDMLEPDEIEEMKATLESIIDAKAFIMASEFIRRLSLRLGETKYGLALARAMGLGGNETIKEASESFLISPQWLYNIQKECELILGPNFVTQSLETNKRGSASQKGWLDINDAAKLLKTTRKQARGILNGNSISRKSALYGAHLWNEQEIKNYEETNVSN